MDSRKIEARFGWDVYPGQYSTGLICGLLSGPTAVDCDARAIFCDRNGKPLAQHISYSTPSLFDGAAIHSGDNQAGDKEDDEIITLDLPNLPETVSSIILTLDLFKEKKPVKTGGFQSVFLRITDSMTKEEIARCDTTNLSSSCKLVVLGTLSRVDAGWAFRLAEKPYQVKDIDAFLRGLGESQYDGAFIR